MLTKAEISILFHIMDNLYPDIQKNRSGRYELKPEECREYVNNISFSESEFKTFCELRQKVQGELLAGFLNKSCSHDKD